MPITQFERDQLISFLNKKNVDFHHGFENYSGNATNAKALVIDIQNLSFLQNLLQKINELNNEKSPQDRMLLRAAAGGKKRNYSDSYAVNGPKDADIVLCLVGDEFLSKRIQAEQVTVGANVQFIDVESWLAKEGLALPTVPLNPYLTLVGLASIGGVGTGRNQPSFSGLLKKVKLCLYSGKIVEMDHDSPDFHCLFATSAGLLGIIVEATFQCSRQVQFQLTQTPLTILNLQDSISSGLFSQAPYTSVFIVPDLLANTTTYSAQVYQWQPSNNFADSMIWTQINYLWQTLLVNVIECLKIPQLLNYSYLLALGFMRYVVKPATIGIRSSIQHGPAHILFHHQMAYAKKGIEDVGWAIPDNGSGEQVLRALQIILDLIKSDMRHNRCLITTGGIYIRYITGTEGGISMCNKPPEMKHIGLIDVVSNINSPGFIQFQQSATVALRRLGAKPHLGKFLPDDYKIEASERTVFLNALNRFHDAHQLDLHRNPFLTGHFCRLLDLPAYMPNPNHEQQNNAHSANSLFNFSFFSSIIDTAMLGSFCLS